MHVVEPSVMASTFSLTHPCQRTESQQTQRARFRHLGDAEPEVAALARGDKATVAIGGVKACVVSGEPRPAPQFAIRFGDDLSRPFPDVPALVERAVGTVGVFELADVRPVVGVADCLSVLWPLANYAAAQST